MKIKLIFIYLFYTTPPHRNFIRTYVYKQFILKILCTRKFYQNIKRCLIHSDLNSAFKYVFTYLREYMNFDHAHSLTASSTLSNYTPLSNLHILFLIPLSPINATSTCIKCGAIDQSLSSLSEATTLRKTDSSSLSSHQLPIADGSGVS